MKRFLMCEPEFFDVCYVINPWMKGNQGRVDKALAQQQWWNLHNIIAELALISLVPPVEGLPDMVFTANSGLVHNKDAIVSSFRHAERQPEAEHFESFFVKHGYNVKHLGEKTKFEGAGDALFDRRGRLWLGSGFRSDAHALDEIAAVLDVEVQGLELVDARWYHLDTCFCPLPNGMLLAYKKALSEKSVAMISRAFGHNVIWISDEDARHFACNAVAIDNRVILNSASEQLKTDLKRHRFELIETGMSEFMKAGGSCKCLTLEI